MNHSQQLLLQNELHIREEWWKTQVQRSHQSQEILSLKFYLAAEFKKKITKVELSTQAPTECRAHTDTIRVNAFLDFITKHSDDIICLDS